MGALHRLVASVILGGGVLLAAACGGGSAQPKAVTPPAAAPKEVADFGILVQVEPATPEAEQLAPGVSTAFSSALSSAGYLVVEKGGKPRAIAKVKVNATEKPSFIQTQVNGKRKVDYNVQLNASFVEAEEAAVIDQASSDFVSSDGAVDANAVNQLVSHLASSGKLAAFAKGQANKVQQVEDDLWKAAAVEGCASAKAATACDGVKAYVAKYPSGKYTADARKALADAEVNGKKNAEDALWNSASVDQCKKPTKSYDCKGIEDYLAKYPTGAHAAEAKDAMKASEKPREALRKTEEASKKKASYEECVKDCRRAYSDYRPDAFEILVNRCVQTECK